MTTPYVIHTATRQHAYVAQAHTWYRYARTLKHRPFDAYQKKKEALAFSHSLRSRAFILPALLDLNTRSEQGLRRLRRHVDERQVRYPELAARVVQVDDDDPSADEVHLFLEETDRTSSRGCRYPVGKLPQEDAFWLIPLLRIETDAYGTGPVIRFFVERCRVEVRRGSIVDEASEIRVVIAHAHEAARQWFDWKDERKHHFEKLYRSTFYDERAYAPALA